jgi:hypothetical protein
MTEDVILACLQFLETGEWPMLHFEVTKRIHAAPARIWAVLTDAGTLQNGTFGIERIEGEIKAGGTIKLWSAVNPGRAFPLRITGFDVNRSMVWQSAMPFGLFKGVRRFTLTPFDGQVSFHMREDYSGLLEPLIAKSVPDLNPSFEIFANALKSASEGVST